MATKKPWAISHILHRKEIHNDEQLDSSNLRRCLSTWDLTALGLGSTLGVGVYVIVGAVALNVAGPSVVLSFLIAAFVSLLAGVCYAEFAARVPNAGSSYVYTYVTIGQLAGFLIGWINILESVVGTACIARGLGVYMDHMTNSCMSQWFASFAPMTSSHFSPYFDFFSFFVVIVIGVVLAFGVRQSTFMSHIFTVINVCVIAFIIIAGAIRANSGNWSIVEVDIQDPAHGAGGFFPYGVMGMLNGVAICIFGFAGFSTITSAAEEVHEPRKAIPISILLMLIIGSVCYVVVAVVVTMMVPYYMQSKVGGVAEVFSLVGWGWAKWVVQIGGVFAILASIYSVMFPLPRLLYAMAEDGMMFGFFAKVTKGKSPAIGTLIVTALIAIVAGTCKLEELLLILCIGTLLSYTAVATSVVVIRFYSLEPRPISTSYIRQIFGFGSRKPTKYSSKIVNVHLFLYLLVCVIFAAVTSHVWWGWWWGGVSLSLAAVLLLSIAVQPRHERDITFKCPLVPLLPGLSIAINIYLLVLIDIQTWARVAIWMLIGIPVYITCVCNGKKQSGHLKGNVNEAFYADLNDKQSIQIIVEEPTPPNDRKYIESGEEPQSIFDELKADITLDRKTIKDNIIEGTYIIETYEQQAVIDQNDGKEATIIDLLDQVIQAEEDTYGEIVSLNDGFHVIVSTIPEPMPHRKSYGELSEAGSEASISNVGQSRYNVIAQVHREDLPKVEEEGKEKKIFKIGDDGNEVTFYNESDTESGTDESGYSDTTDQNHLNESVEELKQDNEPYIPPPPPLNEFLFDNIVKAHTISSGTKSNLTGNIPPPPPFNEILFKKSYTIASRPKPNVTEDEMRARVSVNSDVSLNDSNIVFGSARQQNFANKLSGLLLKQKPPNDAVQQEGLKRSNSTGKLDESPTMNYVDRPRFFLDLNKEILAGEVARSLRPVKPVQEKQEDNTETGDIKGSMSRKELKSKLESIFANGGTQLVKPRLTKPDTETPEDSSSVENIPEKVVSKVEKADTLKLQKAKFGDVLNSLKVKF